MLDGARAQYHLLNTHPINRPECIVPSAADKVDADARLIDEKTRCFSIS